MPRRFRASCWAAEGPPATRPPRVGAGRQPRRAASIVAMSILRHFHHRLEGALGRGAIRVGDGGGEGAWRDLPRQAPFVLAPAAGAFLAAVADDRVPQAVGFGLVVGRHLEREGLAVLERRATVEAQAGDADDGELDRQDIALLCPRGSRLARDASCPPRCWGRSRHRRSRRRGRCRRTRGRACSWVSCSFSCCRGRRCLRRACQALRHTTNECRRDRHAVSRYRPLSPVWPASSRPRARASTRPRWPSPSRAPVPAPPPAGLR